MKDEKTVYDENYPTRRLLDVIGDKWKPIVLIILGRGKRRYGELQRHLPGVSKKMLTQTLRALEGDGLLNRQVFAEVPPKVEYELTVLGRTFLEPVMVLCRWSAKNTNALDAIQTCRKRRFEKKLPPTDK